MDIRLELFTEADVPELTAIMKRAFDEDSRLHLGREGGPPGYDDGSFLRKWGLHSGGRPLKIYVDQRLAGGAIIFEGEKKQYFLGTIFIDTDLQNRGVGTQVWREIEKSFPNAASWNTETPIFSHRNHCFYINKCGFHCVRITDPKDYEEGQFILYKEMPAKA